VSPPRPLPGALVEEGQRMASICNACRYCEGYCAVFPALERRLSFAEGDLAYLANLCHDCDACYYACQYAPPHEFQVNFPKMLAQVRGATYRKYAWPGFLGALFERNGLVVSLATAASLALFLLGMFFTIDGQTLWSAHPDSAGAFYAVLSHRVMVWIFGGVFALLVVALAAACVRFWRDIGEEPSAFLSAGPFARTLDAVLRLRYLAGGGEGCTYPNDKPSQARRVYHQLTFFGFLLCFAATCVATLYHYALGRAAPYPFWSLPTLLGTVGGGALLLGPAGLLWLKARRDAAVASANQTGMDVGFLLLLVLVSLTGLLLLALRETALMGALLALHLGAVMALFVTLPYGKFVHAVYRFTALMRYYVEQRRPLPELGTD
jgi:citrate/tricarballylate utilization protein